MKKTKLSLAFKIAQLIEEHTKSEMEGAVALLRTHGWQSSLLDLLITPSEKNEGRPKSPAPSGVEQRRDLALIVPDAVNALEHSNPELHKHLMDFARSAERKQVLRTNVDIRRFGERFAKSFKLQKSRPGSLKVILAELAASDPERAIKAINEELANASTRSGNDYHDLANYIMKGAASKQS